MTGTARTCTRCKQEKPLQCFALDKAQNGSVTRRSRCKACVTRDRSDRPKVERYNQEYHALTLSLKRAKSVHALLAIARTIEDIPFPMARRRLLYDVYTDALRRFWDPYIEAYGNGVVIWNGKERDIRPSRNTRYLFSTPPRARMAS